MVGIVLFVTLSVIGLLAAIAIPNFIKARQSAQRAACVSNLRAIQGAKETWAIEHKKLPTDEPSDSELFGTTRYIPTKPVCLAGGVYSIRPVSQKPTCTIAGHTY